MTTQNLTEDTFATVVGGNDIVLVDESRDAGEGWLLGCAEGADDARLRLARRRRTARDRLGRRDRGGHRRRWE